ncbi:Transcriptional regulator containing GAF, AAA-type ATPase, and DNA-binding Fis domains [Chitinophaga sp. YR627]|uniref:sigma 54-interacting transcriptional regulator n=1 Tax=Chitinophaga sp. YR627 TaxID=1881041 RepID=UPI0008E049A4|nr:sigma 54-interacting transcriptional regulator [Chitinophaga sp. YR627]SFM89693.1 Transcriptional regulator containing GAF, AAA-type ATPase, and DNA-binding Fis domains [Chitinophaga sp. YR627]
MVNFHKLPGIEEGRHKGLSEMLNEHLQSIESLSEKFKDAILGQLSSDTLQTDDDEKTILLNLSSEIAASRNNDDLFEAVHARLATFFDIEGLTIILHGTDPDDYHFHEFEKEHILSDIKLKKSSRRVKDPVLATALENMISVISDVCFDTSAYADRFPLVELFKTWDTKGWSEFAIVMLKVTGETLGYLFLHMYPHAVSSLRINLLKGISAQFSVGLSNINMIEETLRRKNEMELLLAINTDIASVRNTDELARFIKDKFKKLLGCSHTMIAVCDNEDQTYSAFLLDEDARAKTHFPNFGEKDSNNKISDAILNCARQTAAPLLYDLGELALEEHPPIYIAINQQLQQKVLLVTRLAKGDEVFGFWMIYFADKSIITNDKLQLIESLSHQLCISVANIMANQEIKSREDEKGRLLKFSHAIAPVRDKALLSRTLKIQLHELFGIQDYIIHLLNTENNEWSPLLYDTEDPINFNADPFFHRQSLLAFPDGLLDLVTNSEGPVLYKVNESSALLVTNAWRERAGGEDERIGMFIQPGTEGSAVLSFIHPDFNQIKHQEILLKSICSQISIALSNIIANEKLNRQFAEINRYKQQLEEETIYLKEEIEVNQNYAEIIGESQAMQKVFRMVTQVASSDSTVLILGETGTGKELIARAIHNNSPRKNKLMVKVNCAALPANLIESELFGHEKGSFTGATERRLGKFELANNGTLFLDEIGEMPLELQVKLLRALQEKEIERVGGRGTIKVDVRIIAATNRELEKEVDEGRFRNDLYYRLNIFPIELSALRDRKEDIPILATHFIHRFSKKTGRKITTLGNKALQDMINYSWPGNIRELEHLIERSILLTTGPTLKHIHLPSNKLPHAVITTNGEISLKTIDENECDHILRILKYCQGRISGPGGAAEILGVPPSTLNSKIKRLGIKRQHLV